MAFINDLRSQVANRVQLSSDGHKIYLEAVEGTSGCDIRYAQIVKMYGNAADSTGQFYRPPEHTGITKYHTEDNLAKAEVGASIVERGDLTMRMHMHRFKSLATAFSKKVENHAHAVALHFMFYNFVHIHQSLKTTPAMAAGVTEKPWRVSDIVTLLEEREMITDSRPSGRYSKSV